MSWVSVLSQVAAVATIVAALVTVVGLLRLSTRGARLRRAEAQWRQVLEVDQPSDQEDLVRDLHRHAVARLITRELMPLRQSASAHGLLVASMASVPASAGWHLVDLLVEAPNVSLLSALRSMDLLHPITWFAVLVVGLLLADSVAFLAGHYAARNVITRRILANAYPITMPRSISGHAYLNHYRPEHSFGALLWLTHPLVGMGMAAAAAAGAVVRSLWWRWGPEAAAVPERVDETLIGGVLTLGVAAGLGILLWRSLVGPRQGFSSPKVKEIYTEELTEVVRDDAQAPPPTSPERPAVGERRPGLAAWAVTVGLVALRHGGRRRRPHDGQA